MVCRNFKNVYNKSLLHSDVQDDNEYVRFNCIHLDVSNLIALQSLLIESKS